MRFGFVCLAISIALTVPIFFIPSLAIDQIFGVMSFTFLVIAGLFFAHRLLERIAPAEKEGERTHFNPRNPDAPLRDIQRPGKQTPTG